MKRTYQANISGRVFHIDEDAFELLNNYFDELRRSFSGTEGEEIVGDIETRISELFAERLTESNNVVSITDVNSVIETMGSPAAISSTDDGNGNATVPPPISDDAGQASDAGDRAEDNRPFISINLPGRKKLYRNLTNKVFGGVIGGLAEYLGWNANIMRLLLVIIVLCTKFVSFVPLCIFYLVAWMIIPPADTAGRVLQMQGRDINVDSVGQAVIASNGPRSEGCIGATFEFIGKIMMCFVGLVTGGIGICCFIIFVSLLVLTIMMPFNIAAFEMPYTHLPFYNSMATYPSLIVSMLFTLALSLIFGLITWGAGIVVFRFPAIKRHLLLALIMIAAVLLIGALVLGVVVF